MIQRDSFHMVDGPPQEARDAIFLSQIHKQLKPDFPSRWYVHPISLRLLLTIVGPARKFSPGSMAIMRTLKSKQLSRRNHFEGICRG
jgi:hypothetical protein